MFDEKGIILRSAISNNVKLVLSLWDNYGNPDDKRILVKPIVRRLTKDGVARSNHMWKSWYNAREVAALISVLQRSLVLFDEYAEGTLALEDILANDEDGRALVSPESVRFQDVESMFDVGPPENRIEKDEDEMF